MKLNKTNKSNLFRLDDGSFISETKSIKGKHVYAEITSAEKAYKIGKLSMRHYEHANRIELIATFIKLIKEEVPLRSKKITNKCEYGYISRLV